jgi:flagellar assembly factor FliW
LKIDSTSFGELEIDPETTISFPNGLIGFEENKSFKLFHADEFEGLKWLQSVSDADVALSVMEPADVGYEFSISLSDEETAILGSESPLDLIVLLVVFENPPSENAKRAMSTNWRSPIVLNPFKQVGIQKVLTEVDKTILIRGS